MKKRFFTLSAALLLLAQLACVQTVKPQNTSAPHDVVDEDAVTAVPTVAPTAVLTDVPTQEPTAVPAHEPTAVPTAAPVFPTPGRLGNLIGGPLFDEPGAYFVLDGESDLRYVYDRFGELVTVFSVTDPYEVETWNFDSGIYGEHGVPCGYSIERGMMLPEYKLLRGYAVLEEKCRYYGADGSIRQGIFVTDILGETLEKLKVMEAAPEYAFIIDDETGETEMRKAFDLGTGGTVLRIDGKYLIIEFGYNTDTKEVETAKALAISEDGDSLGEMDLEPFGEVLGVFAEKYIIGRQPLDESEWYYNEYGYATTSETNIYTLEGELVMKNVETHHCEDYSVVLYPRSNFVVHFGVIYANYLNDENGCYYDSNLNRVDKPTDEQIGSDRYDWGFFELHIPNRRVVQNGIYAGIKDDEGNWLFRIYNPKSASDSLPVYR